MFDEIKKCYDKAAIDIHADGIIPSGAAMENALALGLPSIHRDTFHAKLGLGRFLLALVWYRYFTGNSIDEIEFQQFEEPVDESEYQLVIEAVKKTL